MDSKQLAAQVNVVAAIAEAIRELGSVPSGHFYAQVCDKLDLQSYVAVIALLKRTSHSRTYVSSKVSNIGSRSVTTFDSALMLADTLECECSTCVCVPGRST